MAKKDREKKDGDSSRELTPEYVVLDAEYEDAWERGDLRNPAYDSYRRQHGHDPSCFEVPLTSVINSSSRLRSISRLRYKNAEWWR